MSQQSLENGVVEARRRDLIEATLETIARIGLQGATVREIAKQAGVTPGLIRHYFTSKELLFQAAYREILDTMTQEANRAAHERGVDAIDRLRVYVLVCFQPPLSDSRNLSLWATFISQLSVVPALAAINREGYLSCRDRLQIHIAEAMKQAGRKVSRAEMRALAIAVNGVIDGLWLEACMAAELFDDGELGRLALMAVERITGIPLTQVPQRR